MSYEIKIVRTNRLLVQKMDTALVSTHFRPIYRFVEPVPTPWQTEAVFSAINFTGGPSLQEIMAKYFMNRWNDIVANSMTPMLSDEEKQQFACLSEMETIEIVDVDVVASSDENKRTLLPVIEAWRKRLNNGN